MDKTNDLLKDVTQKTVGLGESAVVRRSKIDLFSVNLTHCGEREMLVCDPKKISPQPSTKVCIVNSWMRSPSTRTLMMSVDLVL